MPPTATKYIVAYEKNTAWFGITTASVVVIQRANPAEPGQGPLLVLGPAFADFDEIAADMGPTEDQHRVAQLHLGHGYEERACDCLCRAYDLGNAALQLILPPRPSGS